MELVRPIPAMVTNDSQPSTASDQSPTAADDTPEVALHGLTTMLEVIRASLPLVAPDLDKRLGPRLSNTIDALRLLEGTPELEVQQRQDLTRRASWYCHHLATEAMDLHPQHWGLDSLETTKGHRPSAPMVQHVLDSLSALPLLLEALTERLETDEADHPPDPDDVMNK